jgi:hypothetical protein
LYTTYLIKTSKHSNDKKSSIFMTASAKFFETTPLDFLES